LPCAKNDFGALTKKARQAAKCIPRTDSAPAAECAIDLDVNVSVAEQSGYNDAHLTVGLAQTLVADLKSQTL